MYRLRGLRCARSTSYPVLGQGLGTEFVRPFFTVDNLHATFNQKLNPKRPVHYTTHATEDVLSQYIVLDGVCLLVPGHTRPKDAELGTGLRGG